MARWDFSKFIDHRDHKIERLTSENKRLMEALREIQQVAAVSEQVEWYELVARRAIEGEEYVEHKRSESAAEAGNKG